jgi:hypothetical protein
VVCSGSCKCLLARGIDQATGSRIVHGGIASLCGMRGGGGGSVRGGSVRFVFVAARSARWGRRGVPFLKQCEERVGDRVRIGRGKSLIVLSGGCALELCSREL